MAEFSKLVITNKGQALIAKMIAGEGNIDDVRGAVCRGIETRLGEARGQRRNQLLF